VEEQQVAISQYPTPTPSKRFPWKKPILILVAFIIGFGGVGSVLAWRTTYLDNYLPAGVKEFFGRGEERRELTPGEVEEETRNWKTYKDEKRAYELKYPPTWVYGSTKEGQVVFETSKENLGPGDLASKAIVVTAVTLPTGSDVPDPLIDDELYGEKQKVERTSVTIGGLQGEQVIFLDLDWVYSAVFREGTYQRRIYYFNLHKIEHREIYDLMISTFAFLPEEDPTEGWKTLKNEKYGYSIKYPSTWLTGGGKGTLAQSSPLAYFFVKREDMEHEGGEVVLIAVQAYPGGIPDPLISVKRCKEEGECKDCTKEECDEDELFCMEGCKAERKSITIGGVQGEQVAFMFIADNRLYKIGSAVAQSGTASHPPRVYFFTFAIRYSQYEREETKYREIYDLMLSTFKFL